MCGMVEKVQLAAILQALQLCVAAFRLVCRPFCFHAALYTKIIKLFFFFVNNHKSSLVSCTKKKQCFLGILDIRIAPGRSVPFGER